MQNEVGHALHVTWFYYHPPIQGSHTRGCAQKGRLPCVYTAKKGTSGPDFNRSVLQTLTRLPTLHVMCPKLNDCKEIPGS
jgi:hypothetical protein